MFMGANVMIGVILKLIWYTVSNINWCVYTRTCIEMFLWGVAYGDALKSLYRGCIWKIQTFYYDL